MPHQRVIWSGSTVCIHLHFSNLLLLSLCNYHDKSSTFSNSSTHQRFTTFDNFKRLDSSQKICEGSTTSPNVFWPYSNTQVVSSNHVLICSSILTSTRANQNLLSLRLSRFNFNHVDHSTWCVFQQACNEMKPIKKTHRRSGQWSPHSLLPSLYECWNCFMVMTKITDGPTTASSFDAWTKIN